MAEHTANMPDQPDSTTPPEGLSSAEAAHRFARYGPNEITEAKVSLLRKLLGYFWGPIPWMIEAAALLSLVVMEWADLTIILVLLLFNAAVGFWQEYQADTAIAQLKKGLALKARVRRDGRWETVAARELVPGDLIELRLGDVVPADASLREGAFLSVDQAALTGESLPVDKRTGDPVYSGSSVKQGEVTAEVTETGANTYFGHTAALVESAKSVSHFQKAVLTIGDYLIYLTLGLIALLLLVGLHRHQPVLQLFQFALILTVAAIPVALPAVLSVTMAVGALALSKMKAIVSRLEAIEEMAGIDILCSDKTGTLTENRLTLGEPLPAPGVEPAQLLLDAALACQPEDPDAIDAAVLGGLADPRQLERYRREDYVPFDPVSKRSEATVSDAGGRRFRVTKGAPQVILALCRPEEALLSQIGAQVDELAGKGYRTLGVAREAQNGWRFLGLLPLFDPPREDAAETLRQAASQGIDVKMVTGDNLAIGREVARRLGLKQEIVPADQLFAGEPRSLEEERRLAQRLEAIQGFTQVFPEHKFTIVKILQSRGHLVGMTGDGVNDAPALRQADVGVAVSGATDAARAAADLVLTAPGLSVLVRAVQQARRIFERMHAYAIYRIAETIRIMFFLVIAMLVYDFYPITAVMIILLALLNDIPIMTIAYDNTWLDPRPVRWQMRRVLTLATVLGAIGVIETFGLLVFARSWFGVGDAELQSLIFLKLVVAGHLTLLVARTRRPLWSRPNPSPLVFGAILSTQLAAALIAGLGLFVAPIPWSWVGYVWLYCLGWILVEDRVKVLLYHHLSLQTPRHRRLIDTARRGLHGHPGGKH